MDKDLKQQQKGVDGGGDDKGGLRGSTAKSLDFASSTFFGRPHPKRTEKPCSSPQWPMLVWSPDVQWKPCTDRSWICLTRLALSLSRVEIGWRICMKATGISTHP